MISLTIIMFCFSIQIVNELDSSYETDKGVNLFFWTTEPPLTTDSSEFADMYSNTGMNDTLYEETTPTEQPSTGVVDVFWDGLTKTYNAIKFIINVLINSSLRFNTFIQTLGREDITFVPSFLANPMWIMVNINHIFGIYQLLKDQDFRRGA